jgi:hypothetical protein
LARASGQTSPDNFGPGRSEFVASRVGTLTTTTKLLTDVAPVQGPPSRLGIARFLSTSVPLKSGASSRVIPISSLAGWRLWALCRHR